MTVTEAPRARRGRLNGKQAAAPAKVGSKKLLQDLQKLVRFLEDDLRLRTEQVPDVGERLKAQWDSARQAQRTIATYESWRDEYLTQVAVAWTLACVFVRHLEDNDLVAEIHLAGEGPRLQEAFDGHDAFFKKHPTETDREYLQDVFRTLARLPAMGDLLGEGRNPLWDVAPSGDGSKHLLEFWQQRDPSTGLLLRSFKIQDPAPGSGGAREGALDTRFLGDLYQDLSEAARKRFALLQTPDFVEEFILDRTLEPALAEFGLEATRMIDPTCGSGHFLLGAFHRLFDRWLAREPGAKFPVLAQRALDGVYGIDLNPFAVAIARFRLLVAALRVCGIKQMKDAPGFKIHVASGDSLLHGRRHDRHGQALLPQHEWADWLPEAYAVGDYEEARRILGQQYHAVVGNPPYITDKDECHREVVRKAYTSCYMKFSLGVPFTERFFELAETETASQSAGYVGLITTNSFMKREFGKTLIEKVLPELDITHILDASGAYIPGHGTPTVILFGRNHHPSSKNVRAALGIRGEPGTPSDPAKGVVWHSIVSMLDAPGQQNEFLTVADTPRETFHRHPWSLSGGSSTHLQKAIEAHCASRLGEAINETIGFASFPGQDDAFVADKESLGRLFRAPDYCHQFVYGECVRDWCLDSQLFALAPYGKDYTLEEHESTSGWAKGLWPLRTNLKGVLSFGGKTREEAGIPWWGWYRWIPSRYLTPLSITFAFVSTHNHFVLDRGGKVFKQTAPVIKLSPGASEEDHLVLLGLLNSSVACFWMKQACFNKGATAKDGVLQDDPEKFRFEFDGTKLQQFPIPHLTEPHRQALLAVTRLLDEGGRVLGEFSFKHRITQLLESQHPDLRQALEESRSAREQLRQRMVRWQEELDWLCCELYGLLPSSSPTRSLAISGNLVEPRSGDAGRLISGGVPELGPQANLDEPRSSDAGCRSSGGVPEPGPQGTLGDARPLQETDRPYRFKDADTYAPNDPLLHLRWHLLREDPTLGLLESPEYKRRWFRSAGAYDANNLDDSILAERATREWLLDRLETSPYWPDPSLTSCSQLADATRRDESFLRVAALYRGREDFDLTTLVTDLVLSEGVPYLPSLRYTPSGLRKRQDWEQTWDLQRHEDAGEPVGKIPVPPKYTSTDFQRPEYWRVRGKLDVPKERFILYPGAERISDPTPILGWAGWTHLQQAQALATYYLHCKDSEGWPPDRLRPLLDGLHHLIPWLLQWHNTLDPETGEHLGTFYAGFVEEQQRDIG